MSGEYLEALPSLKIDREMSPVKSRQLWSHPQMHYCLQIVEYPYALKVLRESLHVHLTLQVPGCSRTVRLQVTRG